MLASATPCCFAHRFTTSPRACARQSLSAYSRSIAELCTPRELFTTTSTSVFVSAWRHLITGTRACVTSCKLSNVLPALSGAATLNIARPTLTCFLYNRCSSATGRSKAAMADDAVVVNAAAASRRAVALDFSCLTACRALVVSSSSVLHSASRRCLAWSSFSSFVTSALRGWSWSCVEPCVVSGHAT